MGAATDDGLCSSFQGGGREQSNESLAKTLHTAYALIISNNNNGGPRHLVWFVAGGFLDLEDRKMCLHLCNSSIIKGTCSCVLCCMKIDKHTSIFR